MLRGSIFGWVNGPSGVYKPEELLWTPPGTKPIDLAGTVGDAQKIPTGDGRLWLTSQLSRHDRYLEVIRTKVIDGSYQLTATLARLLGMDWDGGALLSNRAVTDLAQGMHALETLL